MWKCLKNIFKSTNPSPALNIKQSEQIITNNLSVESNIHQSYMDVDNIDDYSYRYLWTDKQLSDFDISILKLKSYDGYLRQEMLEKFQQNFQPALFPHVLNRLSDYVPINRKLAATHIQEWSERTEFSKLCIDHFYEIATLQKRERTEEEIFTLLLCKVKNDKAYLVETLTQQQGILSRILLEFIIKYEWIDSDELFELCRNAKDQKVRAHWLEQIIQYESNLALILILKSSSFREVQYRLFDILYKRNALNTEDLVLMWQSSFISVMDYASFALRQIDFDFERYFTENPISALSISHLRIRAYQWILLKEDIIEFFKIIEQIDQSLIVNSVLFFALKQKYIQVDQYLSFYQKSGRKLYFYQLSKARKYLQNKLSLDELDRYLLIMVTKDEVNFQQRLKLVEGYNIGDQLYWFIQQIQYIQTTQDQKFFENHLQEKLTHLKNAAYGLKWTEQQQYQMQNLLPRFILLYPQFFEDLTVKKLLKPYLK